MNLSQQPETICLHLELPDDIAARIGGGVYEGVKARHRVEKVCQNWFFSLDENTAFIGEGRGTLDHASILILTDRPARALRFLETLLMFFPDYDGKEIDIRKHCAIGLQDKEGDIWRTYHPQNSSRPFWSFVADPETVAALLAKGRAIREGMAVQA